MRKELLLILVICFLVLFQQSFLPHFAIYGMIPNLVLVFVFVLNILDYKSSIILSFWAGLILDIYSEMPLGTSGILFLAMAMIIKKSSKFFQKLNILYLIFIFSFCLVFYNFLLSLIQIKL